MRSKPLVIVVISLLVIALIFSSYSRSDVFAKGKVTTGSLDCSSGENGREMCCQDETGSQGIVIRWCTICDATSPPSNCTPRFNSGSIPITPPKSNDAQVPNGGGPIQQTPPPLTALQQTTCPDGSARDASGNCPLVTQTPPPPALNNNNNNNNPTPDHQKGSNLGQIGGGQSVTKKGNSDNSPTPPACPDKGPIPPDCTLKPKF
jgi:hypothetical protein